MHRDQADALVDYSNTPAVEAADHNSANNCSTGAAPFSPHYYEVPDGPPVGEQTHGYAVGCMLAPVGGWADELDQDYRAWV